MRLTTQISVVVPGKGFIWHTLLGWVKRNGFFGILIWILRPTVVKIRSYCLGLIIQVAITQFQTDFWHIASAPTRLGKSSFELALRWGNSRCDIFLLEEN